MSSLFTLQNNGSDALFATLIAYTSECTDDPEIGGEDSSHPEDVEEGGDHDGADDVSGEGPEAPAESEEDGDGHHDVLGGRFVGGSNGWVDGLDGGPQSLRN